MRLKKVIYSFLRIKLYKMGETIHKENKFMFT